MIICANCGVELDEGLNICPLCGKDPGKKGGEELVSENKPSGILQLQKKENLRYLWELFGILAFSGIIGCTLLDLLLSKNLRWSLFSDISIIAAWVILTLFLFANKKPLVIIPSLFVTVLASVFFIDLLTTGKPWFVLVGIPETITIFLATGIVILLYRAAHLQGLNLIAAAMIVFSGFCIITELVLDLHFNGILNLKWSLIAAVSVLPVALILIFYHYRLKKGNRLDSFFHV